MPRSTMFAFVLVLTGCTPPGTGEPVRSADWIATLPESEIRRQVVLGCTPCHQLDRRWPTAKRSRSGAR